MPHLWRHWWIDTLPIFNVNSNHITLEYPESIIKDRTSGKEEWKNDIGLQILPHIIYSCNKHMIPCVLCSWGCSEFIFSCGYIYLDTIYQRYIKKVKIDLIKKIDVMKNVKFCQDYYIHFDNNYECWLLNKKMDYNTISIYCS